MENSLIGDVLSICKMLNDHSVEYLVVGGAAVALHGYFRMSRAASGDIAEKHDLDFWYNSTYANYFKLLDSLEGLGHDVTRFKTESTPDPSKSFFRFEQSEFTLDFLPAIPGLTKFHACYDKRVISKINDVEIPIIGLNDLIINKEALGRPKDMEDIKQLKLIGKK